MPDLLETIRGREAQGPFGTVSGNRNSGVRHFPGYPTLSVGDQVIVNEVCEQVRPSALLLSDRYLYWLEHESGGELSGSESCGYTARVLPLPELVQRPAAPALAVPGPVAEEARRKTDKPARVPPPAGGPGPPSGPSGLARPRSDPPGDRPSADKGRATAADPAEAPAPEGGSQGPGRVLVFALIQLSFAGAGFLAGTLAMPNQPNDRNEQLARKLDMLLAQAQKADPDSVREKQEEAIKKLDSLLSTRKEDRSTWREQLDALLSTGREDRSTWREQHENTIKKLNVLHLAQQSEVTALRRQGEEISKKLDGLGKIIIHQGIKPERMDVIESALWKRLERDRKKPANFPQWIPWDSVEAALTDVFHSLRNLPPEASPKP